MLGLVGIGAGDEQAPPRHVGERRPHLLAVHHPLLAVAHGTSRQRRDVRAGAWLAEQLTPDLLVLGHGFEKALLLLVGAPMHDRGPAHADADDVERARHLVAVELVVDDLGLVAGEAEEAIFGRPGGRGPSGRTQPSAPVGVVDLSPHLTELLLVAALDGIDPGRRQILAEPLEDAGPELLVGERSGRSFGQGHGSIVLTYPAPVPRLRSLLVGLASVIFAMVLGVSLGLIAGYVGGKLDAFIMRIADVQLSFPAILVALLIDGVARAVLPRDSHGSIAIFVLIFAIGISNWPQYARTVRGFAKYSSGSRSTSWVKR